MRVFYRGQWVEGSPLTSNGQTSYQIGNDFVPGHLIGLESDDDIQFDSPAPVPTSGGKKGKPAAAPAIADDPDPPKGGDLSESVPDPRSKK